ncbi:unnamed protein product [Cuscuta europaea]|uniref:BRCT domain-containing protein n=1 Tax=Cuscuta europaea TaxID=41803 RepID=A0A9P0ZHE6_CUSEU|nr:unnamed protein product [Cuscuta europaea]
MRLPDCVKNLSCEIGDEIVPDSEDEGMHETEGIHAKAQIRGRCVRRRRYAPSDHSCEGYLRKQRSPLLAINRNLDVDKGLQNRECNERANNLGNYIESQEPESSEEDALKFVDLYLSNNEPDGFHHVETGMLGKSVSPPRVLQPNRSQSLARIKNRTHIVKKLEVFDWCDNSSDNEESFTPLNRRKINFDFECNGGEVCDGIIGGQKQKALGNICQLNCVEGRLSASEMQQSEFQGVDTNFVNEVDENATVKSPKNLLEDDQNQMDVACTYEVGFDTQVAAEAMEALSYTLPLNLDPSSKHKGPQKTDQVKRVTGFELPPQVELGFQFSGKLPTKKRTYRTSSRKLCHEKTLPRKLDVDFNQFQVQKCGSSVTRREELGSNQSRKQSFCSSLGSLSDSFQNSPEVMKSKDNIGYWSHPRGKRTCKGIPHHSFRRNNHYASSSVVSNCKSITNSYKGLSSCQYGDNSTNLQLAESYDQLSIVSDVMSSDQTLKTVSSGNHIAPYIFNGIKKGRQQSKSFLTKELTKLGYTESLPDFMPRDSRRRKGHENVKILLSKSLDKSIIERQKKIVSQLGFSITSCCSEASHFVSDKFLRTKNMLEAMAIGLPVLTHLWLESCGQANYFIDEKNFILRDDKMEKEFGFSMPVSLALSRQHPLLRGHKVFITSNVKPSKGIIQSLVNVVQGQEVTFESGDIITTQGEILVISSEEDYTTCAPFLKRGTAVYSSELLLNGIVTQKLNFKRYRLFHDSVKEDC